MKRSSWSAAAAALILLATGAPAFGQYTYGAPDYNYDRGWYGTNNWYSQYRHYDYLYRTPPHEYSIPYYSPGFYSNQYGVWNDYDELDRDQGILF